MITVGYRGLYAPWLALVLIHHGEGDTVDAIWAKLDATDGLDRPMRTVPSPREIRYMLSREGYAPHTAQRSAPGRDAEIRSRARAGTATRALASGYDLSVRHIQRLVYGQVSCGATG